MYLCFVGNSHETFSSIVLIISGCRVTFSEITQKTLANRGKIEKRTVRNCKMNVLLGDSLKLRMLVVNGHSSVNCIFF